MVLTKYLGLPEEDFADPLPRHLERNRVIDPFDGPLPNSKKYLAVGPKKALDFETRVHYNAFVGEYGLRDSFFGNLNKMHKGLGG